MIEECKRYMLEHADEWGVPARGDWKALFYNNYHPHTVSLNLLWFHSGEAFPRVVTKLCRQPETARHEFESLQQVYASAGEFAPRPLHFGQHGSNWGVWMAGVPGFPFDVSERISGEAIRSVAGMVTKMHRLLMAANRDGRPGRYRRTVTEPLRALAEFGTSAEILEGCRRLQGEVTEEWLDSLPAIPQHGDLYAGNLISHGGRWYAIDWESFGAVDLPVYDLFTVLFSIWCVNGETPGACGPAATREIGGCMRSYCEEMGIPTAAIRLLVPLVLVNWFFVQWSDGRQKFATRMYKTIGNYFSNTGSWEKVFA